MEDMNLYELLDIPKDATRGDIKKAYKKMALMYHPDKVSSLGPRLKEVANEEMKKLNNAKDVLLDDNERQAYDASLQRPSAPVKTSVPGKDEIMQLNNILIGARNYIDDLRKINGDVREAENFFIQAKYAVNKGDITRAVEMAQHSKEAAKSILYKYAVNVLLLAKDKLVKHRDSGVDISIAFDRFLEARNSMMNELFLEAVDISMESVNIANDIARKLKDKVGEKKKVLQPPLPKEIAKESIPEPPPPVPKGYVAEWDEESRNKDLDVYRSTLVKVWADGVVTQEEQDELDQMKKQFGVGLEEHEELEKEVRALRKNNIKIYLDAMKKVLDDGIIDGEEHALLAKLRGELKLEKDKEFSI